MAEFPALPLFTDAYLGDTTHLTTIEHGAYLLLLITMWRAKGQKLPDNDAMLARYTRTTKGQWARLRLVIEPFFMVREGFWTQGRLTDEHEAVRQKSKRQSDKAKARWLNNKETPKAVAEPQQSQEDASLTLTHTHKDSVPLGTGDAPEVDFKKVIFNDGLKWIGQRMNKPPDGFRSLLGKWCRDYGDAEVASAIIKAQKESAVDPVSFIEKVLRGKPHGKPKQRHTGFEQQDWFAGTEGFEVI